MVYFYTSANVKMLRNILMDYEAIVDHSPYEYMKIYIGKCSETADDSKIAWVAETFLGIQKHNQFLKGIAAHVSEELSDIEKDYFVIIFHAVTFQLMPKDTQLLYKCLFNLSKLLLKVFTTFLSNNEILAFISQIAQTSYDATYITENIIGPLFTWQPYISEMGHSYIEYVKKIESRKLKPPTIPIQPNVLNRPGKTKSLQLSQISLPSTPPNSILKRNKKMLNKCTIDKNINDMHEKNKQKAANLLNVVKTCDFHYTKTKSERYYKTLSDIKDKTENLKQLPKPKKVIVKESLQPIRETAATIKRLNKRILTAEQEELQWLQDLTNNCTNTAKIEELEAFDRQEREKERLIDIERKHLLGQISYEEAVLAKRKLHEDNKKKYEQFLKEREIWNEEIERWEKNELEKKRKQIEKLSMNELNLLQAKNNITAKKREIAESIKKESEMVQATIMQEKQAELERKINIIKEIRILALIAKTARVPKVIDLTETSELGLLCEMSMAELKERLDVIKISLQEELKQKKDLIKQENVLAKKSVEEAKKTIRVFMDERAEIRKHSQKRQTVKYTTTKELSELKNLLEQRRSLRIKLAG